VRRCGAGTDDLTAQKENYTVCQSRKTGIESEGSRDHPVNTQKNRTIHHADTETNGEQLAFAGTVTWGGEKFDDTQYIREVNHDGLTTRHVAENNAPCHRASVISVE